MQGRVKPGGEVEILKGKEGPVSDIEDWKCNHRFPGCGVWYDTAGNQLHFWNDRLGFRSIYLYEKKGQLVWGSRLNQILEFNDLSLTINLNAISSFLDQGYLSGDATWFEEISLLPPAAHWVYDLSAKSWSKTQYWNWDAIKPVDISFEEAVDLLAQKLKEAVLESLSGKTGQIGISLSGGLDSRALLALAMDHHEIVCYTFGIESSWDVRIACKVAEKSGIVHHVFSLNESNWMEEREAAIWRSDGMKSLIHLHQAPVAQEIASLADLNLNGFLGGIALGGLDVGADRVLVYDRARRFSLAGVWEWDQSLPQLVPFADFKLLEFLYGLPTSYRKDNRLFSSCLRKHYPKLFSTIPWQRTGLSIQQTRLNRMILKYRLPQIVRHFGGLKNYIYTDYLKWMYSKESMIIWNDLFRKDLHPQLKGFNLESYLENTGDVEKLSRALTLTFWFRQAGVKGI